jgi:hypothetical protein
LLQTAPGGRAIWIGGRDGVLHKLDAATGKSLCRVDLNPYNVTTPDQFVREMEPIGEVPFEAAMKPPSIPPQPSYRTILGKEKAPLGPNLISDERLKVLLRPSKPANGDPTGKVSVGILPTGASFTIKVEAGKTYLVELLAAAADVSKLTPETRLEVSVTGARKTDNLPYVAHLPLSQFLNRPRCAFRADEAGKVTVALSVVQPSVTGEGKRATKTYEKAEPSDAGLLAGEVMVAAIGFKGPNLLLEGGPTAKRSSLGALTCQVNPWTGGSTLVRTSPYLCPQAALGCVDGKISNQETAWTKSARGTGINFAHGRVSFKKPQRLTSIAIYEDNTGPVEVDEILYFWAGRTDSAKTDGPVRMAEIEAYADDISMLLDEDPKGGDDDDLLKLD